MQNVPPPNPRQASLTPKSKQITVKQLTGAHLPCHPHPCVLSRPQLQAGKLQSLLAPGRSPTVDCPRCNQQNTCSIPPTKPHCTSPFLSTPSSGTADVGQMFLLPFTPGVPITARDLPYPLGTTHSHSKINLQMSCCSTSLVRSSSGFHGERPQRS